MDDFAPWYVAQVRIVLARVALRLSDVVGRACAHRGGRPSRCVRPDAPVLAAVARGGLRAGGGLLVGRGRCPASLTTAELRILGLLPTHLSFREMGTRLYVSPNTVKTQAQAVYRKLDASSRSEAVARARVLGLLEL